VKNQIHTPFDAKDYKTYLAHRLAPTGETRGVRSRLAKLLGCQPAHISQVLSGSTHFSLEYAIVIDQFLAHSSEESRYFLLMVHRDRAGTRGLREYYEQQMEELEQKRMEIRQQLSVEKEVPKAFLETYYSSWIYAAAHVMLSIPHLQTLPALSQALRLPEGQVQQVLRVLESAGLARREGAHWKITHKRIHLGQESPLVSRHHTNWRLRAVQSCERNSKDDLHYSAVFTLAHKDVRKTRSIFLESLRNAEQVLIPSKEETTYGICMDFFEI
jgi:uncharacterized protein (TIGR02147 family)